MLGTALTTVAFDGAGNPYQVVYPATPTYNTSAVPAGLPDSYGFELIPHRVFVGGFPAATSESELRTLFEKFGHVREAKVIRSGEGASKGYGFITFDSEEEAKLVMEKAEREKLEFRGRRLNLGPAVRRTTRYPRYPQEYTLATPTGQLLTASAFGGFSYAYPPSPYMVVSPTQTSPSFVYSPVASPPCQVLYPFGANVNQEYGDIHTQMQTFTTAAEQAMPTANTTASVAQEPSNQTGDAYTVAMCATPQLQQSPRSYCATPSASLVSMTQPLTPVTPSVISQEPMGYTPGTYYAPAGVPQIDMRHYSQMNPLVTSPPYFLPPNAMAVANTNGQPITVSTPINHSVAQQALPESTQGQRFSGELLPSGWHARPAEITAPLRRPISSMNLLTGHAAQLGHQRADRGDLPQVTPRVTASNQYSA